MAHRAANREWPELRGLIEGSREALRAGPPRPPAAGENAVRVLFLSSHARRGGSERYLETIVDRLGHDWIEQVVCLEDGPHAASLRASGVQVVVLATSGSGVSIMASARKLRSLVKRSSAGVLHANGVKAALVAALAGAGTKVPIVWIKHDFSYDGLAARMIASRCRLVVGVSKSVTEVFGDGTEKVRVVHTGVPLTSPDRPAARLALTEAMGIGRNAPILGLAGRLHPVKGHATLLDVLPEVMPRVPQLEVAIIGGSDEPHPHYEESLRRRADELEVSDRVHWLGHRDDLPQLLGGMDVVVVPSGPHSRGPGREGFPLIALEAMAAGTPVVGFDLGGLPEALGPCGRVVPYGDRAGLVASLVEVLDDRRLADHLGTCGRERVARYFTVESMIRALQAVYSEAAA
jgi:glycosyltransferase involved in cell wall biosynthesis